MRSLILCLLFLLTSCAIQVEDGTRCWKKEICVGNTYWYNNAPNGRGGYYRAEVTIVQVKNGYCIVRHAGSNILTSVDCFYFREHSSPLNQYKQPTKQEKQHGKGHYK